MDIKFAVEQIPIDGMLKDDLSDKRMLMPRRSPNHLAVPGDTVSLLSVTPNNVARGLYCQHDGCGLKFTGTHRRGTLHRHIRLKHMSKQGSPAQEKRYPCEGQDCDKDFKRQDARLKHYRSKHPELGIAAPKSRK
jgi:hypothetical protein